MNKFLIALTVTATAVAFSAPVMAGSSGSPPSPEPKSDLLPIKSSGVSQLSTPKIPRAILGLSAAKK